MIPRFASSLVRMAVRSSRGLSPTLREHLEGKVRVIAPALRRRFSSEWASVEVDLVLVHYLYGLVDTVLPNAGAEDFAELLHDLGCMMLDPDTLECALHTAPPSGHSLLPRAKELSRVAIAAEAFGRHDAQALIAAMGDDPNSVIELNSNNTSIRRAV